MKSKYLTDRGLKVIGADFSERMIEIAKRELPSIDFRVADITNLNTIPERFDAVFAQAVVLHIPKTEIATILRGLKDKLKDDGYLYVAVKEKGQVRLKKRSWPRMIMDTSTRGFSVISPLRKLDDISKTWI